MNVTALKFNSAAPSAAPNMSAQNAVAPHNISAVEMTTITVLIFDTSEPVSTRKPPFRDRSTLVRGLQYTILLFPNLHLPHPNHLGKCTNEDPKNSRMSRPHQTPHRMHSPLRRISVGPQLGVLRMCTIVLAKTIRRKHDRVSEDAPADANDVCDRAAGRPAQHLQISDFAADLQSRSDAELQFYLDNSRWPSDEEKALLSAPASVPTT